MSPIYYNYININQTHVRLEYRNTLTNSGPKNQPLIAKPHGPNTKMNS